MAYKKYIKKNGKTYGPYIYHSKRIGDKVVSNYLGKHSEDEQRFSGALSSNSIEPNESSATKIKFFDRFLDRKYLSLFVFIFVVIGLILLIKFVPLAPSGRVALQIDKEFSIGEPIDGVLKLQMKRGEFIPKDSVVRVKLGEQEKNINLGDILGSAKEGSFFAEGTDIRGDGEGYGFAGEKRIYPDVYFQIVVKKLIEVPEEEKKIEETPSEPVQEPPVEEAPEIPAEQPTEETQPSAETPSESAAEPQTPSEATSEVPASESGITGAVILEDEEIIDASISYTKNFSYLKKDNERIEIRNVKTNQKELGSSIIKIDEKEGQLIFYTNYFEIEQGFGSDYLLDETKELEIGLGQFGIVASEGELEIGIVYNDITIVEVKKEVQIIEESPLHRASPVENKTEKPEEKPEKELVNITNITEINITEVNITNITISNVTEVIVNETNITTEIANATIKIIQGAAIIGRPVEWEKRIEGNGIIKVDVPDDAENVIVQKIIKEDEERGGGITGRVISEIEIKKQGFLSSFFKRLFSAFTGRAIEDINDVELELNETEIAIVKYITPAPEAREEIISKHKKRIVVSGPDNLHYENVLAFTTLNEQTRNAASVRVYWVERNEFVDSQSRDNDGDGFIDYVEWNIPTLSQQTFEVILITGAVHLDENKTFIEDIYEEVRARDDIWKEIPSEHYVRVTFMKNLTSENDITIYARSNYSGVDVSVYEKDKDAVLASYGGISSDREYKIYLSNLTVSQDTFDLFVVGNSGESAEFDWVVDPTQGTCGTLSIANSVYTLTQDVSSTGTCFNIIANNVTLDCQGFSVTYATDGSSISYGINISGYNSSAVKNCRIVEGNSATNGKMAINVNNAINTSLINNNISTIGISSNGIDVSASFNTFIDNNVVSTVRGIGVDIFGSVYNNITASNITTTSFDARGIRLASASNFTKIENNIINTTGTGGATEGIYISDETLGLTIIGNLIQTADGSALVLLSSNGLIVSNNTVFVGGAGKGIEFDGDNSIFVNNFVSTAGSTIAYGFNLFVDSTNLTFERNRIFTIGDSSHGVNINALTSGGINLTMKDSIINTSGASAYDFFVDSDVNSGEWNFTNVTRADGTAVRVNWEAGAIGTLNVFWYLDAYANYTDGTNASGVNITASDRNNVVRFSNLTALNGRIGTERLLEFTQTGPSSRTYFSNYTFNATSSSGGKLNQSWNITTNRFLLFTFNLPSSVCGILNQPNSVYTLTQNVSSTGTCFNVVANNVTLDCQGYEINYSTSIAGYGINAIGYNLTNVKNCNIVQGSASTFSYAVNFVNANNGSIVNNSIKTFGINSNGIYFFGAYSNNIINNTVITSKSEGIRAESYSNNTIIKSNNITTSGNAARGIILINSPFSSIISNNITTNESLADAIFLSSSSDTLIKGNKLRTAIDSNGITLSSTLRSNMTSNNINLSGSNSFGIYLESSDFDIIVNNTITTNGTDSYGISFYASSNSIITNNIVTTNGTNSAGIYLSGATSSNNNVNNNTITTQGTNGYGVYLEGLNNNVSTNTITTQGQDGYGLYFFSGSNYNTLANNIINTSGSTGYGIYLYSSSNSNTVSNNTIITSGFTGIGIYLSLSSNSAISNNTINTNGIAGYGIFLNSDSNMISNNTITTNGSSGYGIYLSIATSNNIINNNISTSRSSAHGIIIGFNSNSNTFNNDTIITNGAGSAGIRFVWDTNANVFTGMNIITKGSGANATQIVDRSHNFTMRDSIINASGASAFDFSIAEQVNQGEWNFTNVTRADGSAFTKSWQSGANGTLNVHWYVDAFANYTNSTNASNSNIQAFDKNNLQYFSSFTGQDGRIPRQILLEYKQTNITGGSISAYFSNYTFNATNPSGGANLSQSWNMTMNRFLVFTFSTAFDIIAPQINFTNPTPPNGTTIFTSNVEINVSIVEQNLGDVKFNWNGTNFTMYNDSLVLMMNFDNRSDLGENDTYVVDVSRYRNNGTAFNGPNWTSSGKCGGAFEFDDNVTHLGIDYNPSLRYTGGELTLSAWIFSKDFGFGYILSLPWNGVGDYNYVLVDNGGASDIGFYLGGNVSFGISTPAIVSRNAWHFITAVANSSRGMELYVDGVLQAAAIHNIVNWTPSNGPPGPVPLAIGTVWPYGQGWQGAPGYTFGGKIDEVQIWNRSLTAREIQELYFSCFSKYNQTQWNLYTNQSISEGENVNYQAFASDFFGNENKTEIRTVSRNLDFPLLNFTNPTPANGSTISASNAEINVSIIERDLRDVKFNWNGTNFTMYNDSLVLMMNFDNRSSLGENDTLVRDLSGHGNDGIVNGSAVWNKTGRHGGAFSFDGINDYIDLGNVLFVGNEVSVEAWFFRRGNAANFVGVAGKYDGDYDGYGLNLDGNNIMRFTVGNGTVNQNAISQPVESVTTPLNQWIYYVGTFNGTTAKLYKNGVLESTGNAIAGGLANSNNKFMIGSSEFVPFNSVNGSIDEVRVWNRSLSADEVREQYYANLYKYNQTQWNLYVNQQNLADSSYLYFACAKDIFNENCTETRSLNVYSKIAFIPPTPINGTITRNTSITINVSIIESALRKVNFDWNGTNLSLYDDSLVLMMNFDNRSSLGENSTYFVDVSRYENNGTCFVDCPDFISGVYGNGLDFDGAYDYVRINNSASLDVNGSITISAWVMVSSFSSPGVDDVILAKGWNDTIGSPFGYQYALEYDTNEQRSFDFYIGNSSSLVFRMSTSPNIAQDVFHHIVGTYNGSVMSIYLDGVLNNSGTFIGSVKPRGTNIILGEDHRLNQPLMGSVDEIRIWNRSLSDREVRELYYSNLQKYNQTQWYLIINKSSLRDGIYNYQSSGESISGERYSTDLRTISIQTNVSGCGVLAQSGLNTLGFDVSSTGTCFNVTANNVELDCLGHSITYALSTQGYGIFVDGSNFTTIRNCRIIQGSSLSDSHAVFLNRSNSGRIESNNLTTSGASSGIGLSDSSLAVIIQNNITTSGSYGHGVLFISRSQGNQFSQTQVKTTGTNANALHVLGGNHNFTIRDSALNAISADDFFINTSVQGGEWNFTNTSFIDRFRTAGVNGTLNVHWYLELNVTNGLNEGIDTADVNISDIFNSSKIITTSSTGIMPRQTLIEYSENRTNTRFFTNYTLVAFRAGYAPKNISLNLTQSTQLNLVLNKSPDIIQQYPIASEKVVTIGFAELNFSLTDIDNDIMEFWVYGSNDSSRLGDFLLYHRKDVVNGNFSYIWRGRPVDPLSQGLVLLYHLDNRSEFGENDTFVIDFSKYGNNGTCNGATCPKWNESGKFAGGFEFDGIDDFINVTSNRGLYIRGNLTIAFWTKLKNNGDMHFVHSLDLYEVIIRSNNVIQFSPDLSSSKYINSSQINLNDGNWHYIAATFNGTFGDSITLNNTQIYVDGVPRGNATAGTWTPAASIFNDLTIGQGHNSFYSDGTIDEVAIWNRSLSAKEIFELYNLTIGTYSWMVNATDGLSSSSGIARFIMPDRPFTSKLIFNSSLGTNFSFEDLFCYAEAIDDPAPDEFITSYWTLYNGSILFSNGITDLRTEPINDSSTMFLFHFNNNSFGENDTFVYDFSGRGHNATCSLGSGTCPKFVSQGYFGGAFNYTYIGPDGALGPDDNTHFVVKDHNELSFGVNITIAAWIYYDNNTANVDDHEIMSHGGDVGAFPGYTFGITDDTIAPCKPDVLRVDYKDAAGPGTSFDRCSNTVIKPYQWHYVAFVKKGRQITFYLDGFQDGTPALLPTETSSTINPNYDIWIGEAGAGATNEGFNGIIDEFAFYNRSLSDADILANYRRGKGVYLLKNITMLNNTYTSVGDNWTCSVFMSNQKKNESIINNASITIRSDFPNVVFIPPTPLNNTVTFNSSVEINVSISDEMITGTKPGIKEVLFNWNTTNFIMYNDSLVLMTNFDNRSALGENATYFVDVSRYGNNGTCSGTECPSFAAGRYFGAYSFDGGDRVRINSSKSINLTTQMTLSAWVYPVISQSFWRTIIHKQDDAYALYASTDIGSLRPSGLATIGGSFVRVNSPNSIPVNVWTYLTTTYNGTDLVLYINGAQVASTGVTGSIKTSNDPLWIGGNLLYGDFFQGRIDEARVWNISLSPEEIKEQYYSNLYKYNQTQWYLYINQTNLTNGTYKYFASAVDLDGNLGMTELRVLRVGNQLPVVTLDYPSNELTTINRTPFFNWTATDPDGDVIQFYQINLSCYNVLGGVCSGKGPYELITTTATNDYSVTDYLRYLIDNGNYYNWTVRANDGFQYGAWAMPRRINIQALVDISLNPKTIDFGIVNIGSNEDTSDDLPFPFVIENNGTVFANVSVNASRLFTSGSYPSNNYQFKIRDNEPGAFSPLSLTSWTNFNSILQVAIVALDFNDVRDSAKTDVSVLVPNGEPPGARNSSVTFLGSLGE